MKDPEPINNPAEIMTLDEVAAYLKVTTRTIYRMLDDAQVPGFKVRGAWRFRKSEVERWIIHQEAKRSA